MTISDTRYNLPIDTRERAVAELTDVLGPVARQGTTVTYSDAVSNLSTVHLTADSTAFHALLGDVSGASFDAGAPLLSAVVVAKDSGQPGGVSTTSHASSALTCPTSRPRRACSGAHTSTRSIAGGAEDRRGADDAGRVWPAPDDEAEGSKGCGAP